MSVPLSQAVAEVAPWLALLEESQDELDVTLLGAWNYPPLTLGTVRALFELAKEISDTAAAYGAQDLDRVLSRER
jgi:hypothetical protein